jgi:hypothetical protein
MRLSCQSVVDEAIEFFLRKFSSHHLRVLSILSKSANTLEVGKDISFCGRPSAAFLSLDGGK